MRQISCGVTSPSSTPSSLSGTAPLCHRWKILQIPALPERVRFRTKLSSAPVPGHSSARLKEPTGTPISLWTRKVTGRLQGVLPLLPERCSSSARTVPGEVTTATEKMPGIFPGKPLRAQSWIWWLGAQTSQLLPAPTTSTLPQRTGLLISFQQDRPGLMRRKESRNTAEKGSTTLILTLPRNSPASPTR